MSAPRNPDVDRLARALAALLAAWWMRQAATGDGQADPAASEGNGEPSGTAA